MDVVAGQRPQLVLIQAPHNAHRRPGAQPPPPQSGEGTTDRFHGHAPAVGALSTPQRQV